MFVDIVTPVSKLVVHAAVEDLRLPAEQGEITVLDGHTELLTLLTTGILSFREAGKDRRFVVSYGFAEVRGNRAMILAETCEESSKIDVERAKKAKEKAEGILVSQMTAEEFRKNELKLRRANLRLEIAQK